MLRKTLPSKVFDFVKKYSRNIDPGISVRRNVIQDTEREIDCDNEDFEEWESDFMGISNTHKDYNKEQRFSKERLKHQIIKRKYFKEKNPNFLTWNEKLQIRYLHSSDPKEWTISKLSESFPALPEVILKIVKTKYLKKESKIENHDASVQKNWTDLKNGQMDNLPQELSNHLKKFSHRSQNFKPFISSEKIVVPQKLNISTEFSDIITGYENLRNKCQDTAESSNKKPDTIMNLTENKDTKLGTTSNRKAKHMTLQEFKDQIKTNVIKGETVAMDDKIILDNAQNNDGTQSIAKLQPEDFTNITKIKDQHGSLLTKSEKDYQHLVYPEKIRIPKDKLKHGYTYRLHDCYYDSDGLFLYRVPGME